MAKTERIYNVPLRKGFQKTVSYKRAKKAVTTLKEFIARHMKCQQDEIRLGPMVNKEIWKRGIKSPPHHVKITAVKEDDLVKVELFGHKYPEKVGKAEEKPKPAEKKEAEKKETVEEKKPEKGEDKLPEKTKAEPEKSPAKEKAAPKKQPPKKQPKKKASKKTEKKEDKPKKKTEKKSAKKKTSSKKSGKSKNSK